MGGVFKSFRQSLYSPVSDDEEDNFALTGDVEMEETKGDEQEQESKQVEVEELYELESWRLEDYEAAIMHGGFFRHVQDMFPPFRESEDPAELANEKRRILDRKFSVAGGSARLMFDGSTDKAIAALDKAINEVSNVDAISEDLVSVSSTTAINRLMAVYHTAEAGSENVFVSDYVGRKVAISRGPGLLRRLAELCCVNPAMDGYLFEAWFFATLKVQGIKWYYDKSRFLPLSNGEWPQSSIIFFDPTQSSIGIPLGAPTWMAPVKWNQAGYDAVYVNKAKKLVRFVQVTRAETHSYDHLYFIELLDKLATHTDLQDVQLKLVELYFVVPMSRLEEFRRPVHSADFLRNVVQVSSSSSAPAAGTRQHRDRMFGKCKALVRVAGCNTRYQTPLELQDRKFEADAQSGVLLPT